jgi:hypothetical protein
MDSTSKKNSENQILRWLKILDKRISRIEEHLELERDRQFESLERAEDRVRVARESADMLEFQIGQYWFAKVGIVILALGVGFSLTLPYKNLPPILPSLLGYVLVGAIFLLSYLLRKNFELISRYLYGGSLLLLFFSTLRLHYFGDPPAIQNKFAFLPILFLATILILITSVRRRSIYLCGISLTLGYVATIITDQALILFCLISLLALLAVYFRMKYHWPQIFVLGIFFTYFTHFLWFLNNPFVGNKIQLASTSEYNLFFLILYAMIFAAGMLFRDKKEPENAHIISSTFLNCLGSFGLFTLISATRFQESMSIYHLLASLIFIGLSIIFWIREKSRFSTFFYSMTGYMALSIAIVVTFPQPDMFVWLCWQSVVVVSTAILFRSKFIVTANFFIFLIIFLAYLYTAGKADLVSMSFGIVALVSARIMNWQKDRLELKTEFMRIAYLASAFFIFPYALYHAVPKGLISLSWIGIAFFYFIMSVMLKNRKYRWMAILTLFLTVGYLFIIGIIKLDPVFRIISFVILGAVLIIISLLYTWHRLKSEMKKESEK